MNWSRSYRIIKEGKVEGIVIFNAKNDKSSYTAEIILKDLHYSSQKSDVISDGMLIQGNPFKLVRSQTYNKLKQIFGDGVLLELKK